MLKTPKWKMQESYTLIETLNRNPFPKRALTGAPGATRTSEASRGGGGTGQGARPSQKSLMPLSGSFTRL